MELKNICEHKTTKKYTGNYFDFHYKIIENNLLLKILKQKNRMM